MKIQMKDTIVTTKSLGDCKPGDVVIARFAGGGSKNAYEEYYYGKGYSYNQAKNPVRQGDPLLILDLQQYQLAVNERVVVGKYDPVIPFVNLRTGTLHAFARSRIVDEADALLSVALRPLVS